ncbi:MAG: hypothetical protein ACYTA5_23945, partial [Planctomycetota bacterium]
MRKFVFFCLLIIGLISGCHGSGPEGQLAVVLMGDPQIGMVEKTPLYVKMAMDDLETLEHDFMAALGDLVQNRAKLYDD